MRPFAKRFIALALCAGLILTGTGGTTASQVDINEISMEAASFDSETPTEATVQSDADTPTSGDAQESKTDTDSGTNASAAGTNANADSNSNADDTDAQNPTADQEELTENGTKSEENTELEEKPEENPQTLTYNDGTVYVSVSAEEGVIPDNASLRVVPIVENADETASSSEEKSEDESSETASASEAEASETTTQADIANSKTYEEIEEKLQADAEKNEYELLGFLAYDIGLEKDGKEIEPDGDVTVTMEYVDPVLPEGIDDAADAEVTVMHLEENKTGEIKNVVDLSASEKGTTLTTTDKKIKTAEFVSDKFSTFTIAWKGGTNTNAKTYAKMTVYYVDESGNEIDGSKTAVNITDTSEDTVEFATYAGNITASGYKYKEAHYNSYTGTVVASAKLTSESNDVTTTGFLGFSSTTTQTVYYLSFYDENGTQVVDPITCNTILGNSNSNSYSGSTISVYLVYGIETIETADTRSKGVTINLFDYNASDTSLNNGEDAGPYTTKDSGYGINAGHYLKFSNKKEGGVIAANKWNEDCAIQGILASKLVNGYPALSTWGDGESLAYLFNDTNSDSKKSYMNLNKLFTYDKETGYYSYNSGTVTVDNDKNLESNTGGNFATIAGNAVDGADFTVYKAGRAGFFPFTYFSKATYTHSNTKDNKTEVLGNTNINHYFGMTISTEFIQPTDGKIATGDSSEDMEFTFSGDDDVWVFIDGVLVLDIGGIHGAVSGAINFSTGVVTVDEARTINSSGELNEGYAASTTTIRDAFINAYGQETFNSTYASLFESYEKDGVTYYRFNDNTAHTMNFYYLERGNDSSNCSIKFNLQTLPKGSLVASKTVTGLDKTDEAEYEFILTNKNGDAVVGAEYTIYGNGISSSGTAGNTLDGGTFYLKNGQYVIFKNLEPGDYTVKENNIRSGTGSHALADFYTYATYYDSNGDLVSDEKYSANVTVDSSKTASVSFLNTLKPDNERALEKRKYVEEKDDETYDLTLEFSGKVGTRAKESTDAINADIVIVTGTSSDEIQMVKDIAEWKQCVRRMGKGIFTKCFRRNENGRRG
jgi:fibro-slime domain-containing protein